MQIRGSIRDIYPPPPPIDELIRTALDCRPDVVAYRLAIQRAEAEVRLAEANRMSDVYLLYQPYTFQNNAPFNRQSATSWALGVTVPLPLYNRNQGNIQRARINVTQSQVELAEREQQVVNEVRRAEREYALTRAAVRPDRGPAPAGRRSGPRRRLPPLHPGRGRGDRLPRTPSASTTRRPASTATCWSGTGGACSGSTRRSASGSCPDRPSSDRSPEGRQAPTIGPPSGLGRGRRSPARAGPGSNQG